MCPATVLTPSAVKSARDAPAPRSPDSTKTTSAVTVPDGAPPSGTCPRTGPAGRLARAPGRSAPRDVRRRRRRSRRRAAPPGPATLPYAGPARPSLPAGTIVSMSRSAAPAIAFAERAVGERRVRLDHADERYPCCVERRRRRRSGRPPPRGRRGSGRCASRRCSRPRRSAASRRPGSGGSRRRERCRAGRRDLRCRR